MRNLSQEVLEAMRAETVQPRLFAYFDFPSGPLRFARTTKI